MAGLAQKITTKQPDTVPLPCLVEDSQACRNLESLGLCEFVHGRDKCLAFVFDGEDYKAPDTYYTKYGTTKIKDEYMMPEVPLPDSFGLVLTGVLVLCMVMKLKMKKG